MEDPAQSTTTPLERVPVLDSGTRVPVVASDEGKAKPSDNPRNVRAKNVLSLLADLANMKDVSSSKAVRDRVKAITSLVEIDLEVSESESNSDSEMESKSESGSKPGSEPVSQSARLKANFLPPPEPVCSVERHLMEEWKLHFLTRSDDSGPIIHAFYHEVHTPSSKSSPTDDPSFTKPSLGRTTTGLSGDRGNLRRVLISSRILHAEFEKILYGTLDWPIL